MPPRDYEEFIAAMNAPGLPYLVIGAHAVALQARPRATKDLLGLDDLIRSTHAAASRRTAPMRWPCWLRCPGVSIRC